MRHKMQCEGKIVQNPGISSLGNKVSNSQWVSGSGQLRNVEFIEDKSNQVRTENQSKHFMEMFEQRFIVRKKTLDKYLKFIEVNSNSRDYAEMLQEMAKALDDLNVLSNELLTGFRPQFTPLLEELYGITTSEFILKLDQILDLTLQAKFNLLMQNHEAVRRFLFNVH